MLLVPDKRKSILQTLNVTQKCPWYLKRWPPQPQRTYKKKSEEKKKKCNARWPLRLNRATRRNAGTEDKGKGTARGSWIDISVRKMASSIVADSIASV
jgi:hypothetical protein